MAKPRTPPDAPPPFRWLWDAAAALGLLLLAAGLWWTWPPLALIVVGLALLALGLAGARSQALRGRPGPPARKDAADEP